MAIWAAIGFILHLDSNQYLILGIPMTVCFQLFVRKQPLRFLWLRGPHEPGFERTAWPIALVLAVSPLIATAHAVRSGNQIVALWGACATAGSIAAAFALTQFRMKTLWHMGSCAAVAGGLAVPILVATSFFKHGPPNPDSHGRFSMFATSLLNYFPACFLLEEVSFRGALDSHLYQPGESRALQTAIAVSALWGLWHLPIVKTGNLPARIAGLIFYHCLVGIPLSLWWRKSGNLVVPAFSHALIDAARNALML